MADDVLILTPARLAATRLPGKPLADIAGLPMIVHVLRRAQEAAIGPVVVATDSEAIAAAVEKADGRAVMTRADHATGSDRIFEALQMVDPEGRAEVIVNLQGDEPQIEPAALDRLAGLLGDEAGADMATLAVPIADRDAYLSPNVVKVVCDDRGRALYFSRSPIPMVRDGEPDFAARPARFLQHLGLYAYRAGFRGCLRRSFSSSARLRSVP